MKTKVTTWPETKMGPKLKEVFLKSWGKKLGVFVSNKDDRNVSVTNKNSSNN